MLLIDEIESSLADQGKSVLERVLRRKPTEAAKILEIDPLIVMIRDKWEKYYRFYFLWFILYILYMAIFTACALHRTIGARTFAEMYHTRKDWFRFAGEMIVLIVLPLFFY